MTKKTIRTRIISAFPGTGKSYYHELYPKTTLDSDSSKFSWIIKDGEKIRNPNFPNNYIKYIKNNIGHCNFIFVSTHKEIREALLNNCIFFYLIYPKKISKNFYLQRYRNRGNQESFVKLLDENWNKWIKECTFTEYGCKNIQMIFPTLEKELQHIIASEYGDVLKER